jgi:hypothetical protein
MVLQILHVSHQIFFIAYYIIKFCGQSTKENSHEFRYKQLDKTMQGKSNHQIVSSVSLGHRLVLVYEIFSVLQEPYLKGTLLFQSIEFIPKLNIFHDFLSNSAVYLLQLASSIFHCSPITSGGPSFMAGPVFSRHKICFEWQFRDYLGKLFA